MSANSARELRRLREQVYHSLYDLCPSDTDKNGIPLCVYCGEYATGKDHCPPISRVIEYRNINLQHEYYLLVQCCMECNLILGDSLQDTIFNRIEVLKNRLTKKYRRQLIKFDWDEEELEELGENMRRYVEAGQRASNKERTRIEYYGGYDVISDEVMSREG